MSTLGHKKKKVVYGCHECGTTVAKWRGQCPECEAWNSIHELPATLSEALGGVENNHAQESVPYSKYQENDTGHDAAKFLDLSWSSLKTPDLSNNTVCWESGIAEFDRVCGGGIFPGAVILLGGDPGTGKSTLLLQVAAALAQNLSVAYASGEESLGQIQNRAQRLELQDAPLSLCHTHVIEELYLLLQTKKKVDILIVDSIQTLRSNKVMSAAGTVAQIRFCTQELINWAKALNMAIIIISHVTKDGIIAGPKLLEHMVDTVLYFEGDRHHQFRLLRSIKNRFGPLDEVGVFDMQEKGLVEIANPSLLFTGQHVSPQIGSCLFGALEGTRAFLVEIQALVVPSFLTSPRRSVVGWDAQRLAMILAVMETHGKMVMGQKDVFLNVVGGFKISETGADLAALIALTSAFYKKPLPIMLWSCGEIGLTGTARNVARMPIRIKEGVKMGAQLFICPQDETNIKNLKEIQLERQCIVKNIHDIVRFVKELKSD